MGPQPCVPSQFACWKVAVEQNTLWDVIGAEPKYLGNSYHVIAKHNLADSRKSWVKLRPAQSHFDQRKELR